MPSLLTGNSTATGTTGTTGTTGSSSRSSRSDGSSGNGFDQMLQGGGNTPAAKTASAPSKPANKASNSDAGTADARTPAGSADATDPDAAKTEVAASTTDTPAPATDKDAATDSDDAPWPPLGLAGLALMVAPVADPTVPALPTATGAGADALPSAAPAALATLPAAATAATPATAPAATGVAATTTAPDADSEAIELPLPGTVLAQSALDGADDADGSDRSVTAPLQVALPAALQDLKAALASPPVFNGEPTPTPVLGDDGFDQAIGARVSWLADQKIGHAHITLNPEDLGPVDVRLQMNGDKVHASFSSPHVDVRQALESSLPRLRELLGEQGFQLAHADVGHHSSGDGGTSGQNSGSGNGRIGDGEPSLADTTVSAAQLIRQRGLLDAYA
ncbi:flagellar hook-length control protein FliK [Stenotrophomonas sp. ZAC14D2_NAIMI4_7]|uniref:flagellar hook-length control protein FliK n=1 Tax=Stenotrophomonas sp. ZAC14D2_NAIMI4_7 TaxID=2072405 RepID=UPI000D540B6E|nr:flagellar hook-length control protein FliK [Stenotrophomonas sp. ZAC14D2_NAIMI4_7]AWH17556.1 flagellar hook-length control protein FliK [Stenotrophomonas sp. ZAC14D2_NAIMI4_7]